MSLRRAVVGLHVPLRGTQCSLVQADRSGWSGQVSSKRARVNWLSPDWTFVRDTSSLSNTFPSSEMKGSDNAAIFSSLMSSQAPGIESLFPEGERVSSSAHHTTKTTQMNKHLQSTWFSLEYQAGICYNTSICYFFPLVLSTAHPLLPPCNKFTAHLPSFLQILMIKWGNCPK